VIAVDICQSDVPDDALLLQSHEFVHNDEKPRIFERPPVQLQQIDRIDAQSVGSCTDPSAHGLRRVLMRLRAPFRKEAGTGFSVALQQPAPRFCGNQFRRSVMVSHIKSVETLIGIVDECLRGFVSVQFPSVAFQVGNLPQAGNDPAHVKIRGEQGSFRQTGHGALSW